MQNVSEDLKIIEREKAKILDMEQPDVYNIVESAAREFTNFESEYRKSVNNAIYNANTPCSAAQLITEVM